ncbi:MAG: hypothetical protein ABSH06_28935 [Thermodesulfobacteriota bacterium]
MRNLQRWSVILAFVMGIFGCTQQPTSFKPNSEPDGFAGIKWGTEFSEVKSDMVESRSTSNPTEPNVKIKIYYTKKADNLKMGEALLDKIEYGFWKGKFAEVQITAIGPENFDHLKKVLFEKYGTVDKPVQGAYFWDGSITQMVLRYDEPTKTSSLTIASTKIINQAIQEMVDQD